MQPTYPIPPSREIPSHFSASIRSWLSVSQKQAAISEERLLRRLPFFLSRSVSLSTSNLPSSSSSDIPVIARSSRVNLNKQHHFLNTFSITSTSESPSAPPPVVLLHGYGAGLGFFYKNFPALAQWAGRRGSSVYALDWLGMGRSARVPFSIKAKRENVSARVSEAESFFVDSLEEWRQKMGLDKMTFVGHSLGAYFGVAYALKYPSRVNKLILLSPAGVHRDPNFSIAAREFTDEGGDAGQSDIDVATQRMLGQIREEQKAQKQQKSRTRRILTYLWEEGWSPFQVVRSTLFWGPMLIGKYSSRRFAGLSDEDTRDLHDYIMNITLAKGSGEYCISHILAPGAHARMPLVDRIAGLNIPVTFVYGDQDWMDPKGGTQSVENLRVAGNEQGRMYIISGAGHHVYLDNSRAVNELLVKELDRH